MAPIPEVVRQLPFSKDNVADKQAETNTKLEATKRKNAHKPNLRDLIFSWKLLQAWSLYEKLSATSRIDIDSFLISCSTDPRKNGMDFISRLITFLHDDTFGSSVRGMRYGTNDYSRCLRRLTLFLSDLDRLRIRLPLADFDLVLLLLGKLGQVPRAEELFLHASRYTLEPPGIVTYNRMLSTYLSAAASDPTSRRGQRFACCGEALLGEMTRARIEPNRLTYNILVSARTQTGDLEGAEQRVREMRARGIEPNQITYHTMIHVYLSRVGGKRREDSKKAHAWLEEMIKSGYKPKVRTFNILLSRVVGDADGEQGWKGNDETNANDDAIADPADVENTRLITGLYKMMRKLGVSPDVVTMNVMLKWFIQRGDDEGIRKIVNRLKLQNGTQPIPGTIVPDTWTFNMLIAMHLSRKEEEKAHRLMGMMREHRLAPSEVTYGCFVDYFVRRENIEEALTWIAGMKAKGIKPGINTFNMVVRGVMEKGGLRSGGTMIAMMTNEGVEMNAVTYNTLMRKMKGGRWGEAEMEAVMQLYDSMLMDGVKPTSRTFNQLLHRLGETEAAGTSAPIINSSYLLAEMTAHSVPRDSITYALLIRNAVLRSQLSLAERAFSAMIDAGFTPTRYIFAHLVLGHVRAGDLDRAESVIRRMRGSPFYISPNAVIYTSLVHGYATAARYDRARQVFQEMTQRGCRLDVIAYTVLANSMVEGGGALRTVRVLEKIEEVVGLDHVAITSLVTAYGIAGGLKKRRWNEREESEENEEACAKAVERIYREEVEGKVVPDEAMITSFVTAFSKLGRIEAAVRIFEKMRVMNLNVVHFNALLTGMIERREKKYYMMALRVFEEMIGQSIAEDVVSSLASPSTGLPSSDTKSPTTHPPLSVYIPLPTLAQPAAPTPRPDAATFDILLDGAGLQNDWSTVVRLWRVRKSHNSCSSFSSPSSYSSSSSSTTSSSASVPSSAPLLSRSYAWTLRGMLETSDFEGAREVYKEIVKTNNRRDVWSYRVGRLLGEFGWGRVVKEKSEET